MAETKLLWHTRPRDDSAFFANELAPFGIESIIGPVLQIMKKPVTSVVERMPNALLLTSRHACHALAAMPASWRALPTYCVGNATAKAATEHGFTRIISGTSDVQALLPRISGEVSSGSTLLYLAGDEIRADVKTMLAARGIDVTMAVVYYAIAEAALAEPVRTALAEGKIGGVALFSPRTARIAGELMHQAGLAEAARGVTAYCFSSNVAEMAASMPWAGVHTCQAPTRRAMRELIISHHTKN
jgi:uroporphyrinogen-III synthase